MPSQSEHYSINQWAYAWGKPVAQGLIREKTTDYRVTEQLKENPMGTGEHQYLYIEKENNNTEWLANQLAEYSGVAKRDIGYAGMKDRRAVTRQWFSVRLASEPNWQALEAEGVHVLEVKRHQRKLRRGALMGNQFEIAITHFGGDKTQTTERLQTIKQHGVPNYFGEQRFGKNADNVDRALSMFAGKRVKRNQRSIYLSAARSYIFNEVLNQRIQQNNWQTILSGDVLMLSGSNSVFVAKAEELEELQQRLVEHDLYITGPLAGEGKAMIAPPADEIEESVYDNNQDLVQGLKAAGVTAARRSLVVIPQDLQWEFGEKQLKLSFFLPAGSYATSVLREVVDYTVAKDDS